MSARIALLLIGINILWGGSSLAAKVALGTPGHAGLPPMTLAFVRFSLAALLMYGVALGRKVDLAVSRGDWGRFWAMGILGLALTYLLGYIGIQRTAASAYALIIATEPVFLAILSFLLLQEPMPASKVGGIAAGLLGVYLIVANGWAPVQFSGAVLGDLLIALGLVFEASSSIVGKGLVARYPAVTVMTYQMTSGAITLAPFALYELFTAVRGGHPVPFPTASVWLSLLYLVVPCTVFAYTVWFTILDKRQAGEMSVFLFIQPVVGTLLGVWLLHERLTPFKIVGALLVLLAVGLIHRRPPARALPPSPPPSA